MTMTSKPATVVELTANIDSILQATPSNPGQLGMGFSDLREAADLLMLLGHDSAVVATQYAAKYGDETFLSAPVLGATLYVANKIFSTDSDEARAWHTRMNVQEKRSDIACFYATPEASFPVAPAIDHGQGVIVFDPEKNNLLFGTEPLHMGGVAFSTEGTLRQEGLVTLATPEGQKETLVVASLDKAIELIKSFGQTSALLSRRNVLSVGPVDMFGPTIEEASLVLPQETKEQQSTAPEIHLRTASNKKGAFWTPVSGKYPQAKIVNPTIKDLLARRKTGAGFRPRFPRF